MSSENNVTRRRILRACVELLEEGAGAGVRMADIAKRAGVSRQALYLHYATRTELLVAMTFYVDDVKESDARLAPSRAATSGRERLDAFVGAWVNYVPDIYPYAWALIAAGDSDEDAQAAWRQRMEDMREGCEAAIAALKKDGDLVRGYSAKEATDLLWTLLQVENYKKLVEDSGWSQAKYAKVMGASARQLFVKETGGR